MHVSSSVGGQRDGAHHGEPDRRLTEQPSGLLTV
jgi:hypothetical protein